jgi:bacterioferritin-associated ferredoxin
VNDYFYNMILQQVLVGLIFLGAIVYIGSIVYKTLQAKTGCASGCGKCGAIDFAKIEQQLKEKENKGVVAKPRL